VAEEGPLLVDEGVDFNGIGELVVFVFCFEFVLDQEIQVAVVREGIATIDVPIGKGGSIGEGRSSGLVR
jgi:hypothetical protein